MSTNSGSSLALMCDSKKIVCCYIIYFSNFIFAMPISFCIDKFSCLMRATDVAYCVNSADTILALTATTHHIKRDVESSSSSSSSSSSDDCTIYDELVFDGRTVKREKVLILKKVCDSLLKRKLIWFINVFQ